MDSDTDCPKGGEHKLVEDIPGEKSCTKCGITIKVHEGTGDNPVIDDHGLGSNIDKDNTGFRKIARHHKFVPGLSFAKEVALADRQIEIASGAQLPRTVQNRALALFKKTRKHLKGKNFETFVGACLFIACREQGIAIHILAKSEELEEKKSALKMQEEALRDDYDQKPAEKKEVAPKAEEKKDQKPAEKKEAAPKAEEKKDKK